MHWETPPGQRDGYLLSVHEEGLSSPARNLEAGKDSTNITLGRLAPGTCYLVEIWAVAGPYRSLPRNTSGCTGEHPQHPQVTQVGELQGAPGGMGSVFGGGLEGTVAFLLMLLACSHLLPLAAFLHQGAQGTLWVVVLAARGKQGFSGDFVSCSGLDLFFSNSYICLSLQFLLLRQT